MLAILGDVVVERLAAGGIGPHDEIGLIGRPIREDHGGLVSIPEQRDHAVGELGAEIGARESRGCVGP